MNTNLDRIKVKRASNIRYVPLGLELSGAMCAV